MTGRNELEYTFSHETESYAHPLSELSVTIETEITVPIGIFRHASTVQALARYLVDVQGKSFTEAALLLGRNPKSIWASYHQTGPLHSVDEGSLHVPLAIFSRGIPALEALVLHLKSLSLRNVEIARLLHLDPRTTHTAARRGEARR